MQGRPLELTEEIILKAEALAKAGVVRQLMPGSLGVANRTFERWIAIGKADPEGDDPRSRLWRAIQVGESETATRLVDALHTHATGGSNQAVSAATWLLTHLPGTRDTFSDAAATRREVRRVIGEVIDAIKGCNELSSEQKTAIFLELQARQLAVVDEAS